MKRTDWARLFKNSVQVKYLEIWENFLNLMSWVALGAGYIFQLQVAVHQHTILITMSVNICSFYLYLCGIYYMSLFYVTDMCLQVAFIVLYYFFPPKDWKENKRGNKPPYVLPGVKPPLYSGEEWFWSSCGAVNTASCHQLWHEMFWLHTSCLP